MKQIMIFGLLVASLAFVGCDDDDGFQFVDPDVMNYDGANANAPILPAGNVELAAQFGSDAMTFYQGKQIEAVQLFIYEVPASAQLVIYGNGNGDVPGNVLFQAQIADGLQANGWNTLTLNPPVDLPNDEIWISIQLPDGGGIQVLGCDAGPAQSGGDWMYEESDEAWRTFRDRSTDNINWNIRALMSE